MDIRKIIGIILAAALAVVLFILIRSDRGTTPAAQADATPIMQTETTPFAAETEAPDEVPHYHIAVLSSSELAHYPLVRIDLEGLEVPVYACTDAEGKVCFFVYGFEEVSGQYGFLPAYPAYPEVRVDNSQGFAELPRLSKGWTDGESGYPELALASVNGEAAQFYYPADEEGNMRDGAIPVSVEEVNHIFGAYFVFDEAHKALICPLNGAPETPAPTDTEAPDTTAEPSESPASTAAATDTPKPTQKPSRTPKPSAKPSATATTEPSATPTTQPTEQATAEPTGSGHWELVWVIDQPEIKHKEWHCNVCGKVFYDEASCKADQEYHKKNGGVTGCHWEWVVDTPEEGHWEPVWVPDP